MITDALVLGLCAVITGWAVYRTRVTISMNRWLSHDLKNADQHAQGLQDEVEELEAEVKRLREALERVDSILRNDLYKNRVRNALIEIQDALEGE